MLFFLFFFTLSLFFFFAIGFSYDWCVACQINLSNVWSAFRYISQKYLNSTWIELSLSRREIKKKKIKLNIVHSAHLNTSTLDSIVIICALSSYWIDQVQWRMFWLLSFGHPFRRYRRPTCFQQFYSHI